MAKRFSLTCAGIAAALLLLGVVDSARAQVPYNPSNGYVYRGQNDNLQRPTTSPYLNLLRNNNNGSNMGLNYYNLVRPQVQTMNNLQQQQNEQQRLDNETQRLQTQQNEDRKMLLDPSTRGGSNPLTGAATGIRPTGHRTTVMNLNGKFKTR